MAKKQKYPLNPGEKIVLKMECVQESFWGNDTRMLVVTNQAVIIEKYGTFDNFKGIIRFPLNTIEQAIIGKKSSGSDRAELYLSNGKMETFRARHYDEKNLKIMIMAINDQKSPNAEDYDYSYYQTIIDNSAAAELAITQAAEREKDRERMAQASNSTSGVGFVGDVAKNVISSGNLSLGGVAKGIAKASGKKKGIMGGFVDNLLDDIGVHDLQDMFTELGNDVREEFGLKHKMTHEERRALEAKAEKEAKDREKRKKKDLELKKKAAYSQEVERAKAAVQAKREASEQAAITPEANSSLEQNITDTTPSSTPSRSLDEQVEALKKLKELLDIGILTQEEFDLKKKEIMNL